MGPTSLFLVRLSHQGALGFRDAVLPALEGVRPRSCLPDPLVFSVPPPSLAGSAPCQECPPFPIFQILQGPLPGLPVPSSHPAQRRTQESPKPQPLVLPLCMASHTLESHISLLDGAEGQLSLPTR